MIREIICWRCECLKCGHVWTTKGHEIPKTCAKCKVVTWNADYEPNKVSIVFPEPGATHWSIGAEMSHDPDAERVIIPIDET